MNQVRNSWRFNHEGTRETEGFFDASIWENSQRTGSESLKELIREGIKNTSVTCLLVGAETFGRRWVRYEIARSVVKGNGLLSVKINQMVDGLGQTCLEGPNPLDFIGVYKGNDLIFFAERKNGNWVKYQDYTLSVELPPTWVKPQNNNVIPLSFYAANYCYKSDHGIVNFSSWVRKAATDVGR